MAKKKKKDSSNTIPSDTKKDVISDEIGIIDIGIIEDEEILLAMDEQIEEAGKSLQKINDAINWFLSELVKIGNEIQAEMLIAAMLKRNKGKIEITKKSLIDKFNKMAKESKECDGDAMHIPIDFPAGVDEKLALVKGWFEHKNQYFFIVKDGLFCASNFIIKPLYHIYSKSDNKRIVELISDHKKVLLDVPSKSMISLEQFQQFCYGEGSFLFYGTKMHYYKILGELSREFPIAEEFKTLGWQREGFWSMANGIYANGEWQEVDSFGITTFNKRKYWSPSYSSIYKDVREDDDEYENDRTFVYVKSKRTFEEWAELFHKVYGDNGLIGIAYLISSVFRDIAFGKYYMFPHLFLFGQPKSGKSTMARSLFRVFFHNQKQGFNLTSGTNVGLYRRLSRVRNGITWFEEYANDIDEKRFQALKAAYDGTGHEKGKMSKDSRTEITKVNTSVVITGQYLPTRDDSSLMTRCILLTFEQVNNREQESIDDFEKLTMWEEEGLSGIMLELLEHRVYLEANYVDTYQKIFANLKKDLIKNSIDVDERMLRNMVAMLTPVKLLDKIVKLSFTYEELYTDCFLRIEDMLKTLVQGEALSTFFTIIEYMFENKVIDENNDFILEKHHKYKSISLDKKNTIYKYSPEKDVLLLYMRLSRIHPSYMELHRKMYGTNGIDMSSVTYYLENHKSCLGKSKAKRFGSIVTTCYVFDMSILNLSISSKDIEIEEFFKQLNNVNINNNGEKTDDLPY